MARTPYEDYSREISSSDIDAGNVTTLQASGGEEVIDLPAAEFIADAEMLRDGQDLVLEAADGSTVIIEGYFNADPAPMLLSPEGAALTPSLVNSFVQGAGPLQYAQNGSMDDASPIGTIQELSGEATVTHPDGSTETVTIGTPIYQGDIVETAENGALNILFVDESTFAISDNARMAIDEYVYDPESEVGVQNFSVLQGVFVFTSGLIGRKDPDDVEIDTPVGSIGIRGTTIAGHIDPEGESHITVVEGAIVIRNGAGEATLSDQFETMMLNGYNNDMRNMGQMDEASMADSYGSVHDVAPDFVTSWSQSNEQQDQQEEQEQPAEDAQADQPTQEAQPEDDLAVEGEAGNTEQPAEQPTEQPGERPAEYMETMPDDEPLDQQLGDEMTREAPDGEFHDEPTGQEDIRDDDPLAANEAGPETDQTYNDPMHRDTTMIETTFDGGNETSFDGSGDSAFGGTEGSDPTYNPDGTRPNAPIDDGSGTERLADDTTSRDTGSEPLNLIPLQLDSQSWGIDEDAGAGEVIAVVHTTEIFDKVSFNVSGWAIENGFIETETYADHVVIKLTADGAAALQTFQIDAGDILGAHVTATLPIDGRTTDIHVGAKVLDPLTDGTHGADLYLNTSDVPINPSSIPIHGDGFKIFGPQGSGVGIGQSIALQDLGSYNHLSYTTASEHIKYDINSGLYKPALSVGGTDMMMANIGDIDGDGIEDMLLSSASDDDSRGIIQWMQYDGSSFSTSPSGSISGANSNDQMGSSIAGIGDLTGDGLDDFIVGAAGENKAYIFTGAPGTNPTPAGSETGGTGFGTSVAGAGDFDNDGYADYMISEVSGSAGKVNLFYNGASHQITGIITDANGDIPLFGGFDINGDGISDVAIANTVGLGSLHFIYGGGPTPGTISGDDFTIGASGDFLVGGGSVGDFNGDGFDDFAVVYRNMTDTFADIFVVYGNSTLGGLMDESNFNSGNSFHMSYNTGGTYADGDFSFTITTAGDMNGDGFDDMAIGMSDARHGDGEIAVVYGQGNAEGADGNDMVYATGPGSIATATADDNHLIGDRHDNTLTNTMKKDVSMRGGAGDDTFEIGYDGTRTFDDGTNTNLGNIDGGTGHDVLKFSGIALDFSNVGSEGLSGIEKFELVDNDVDQTLKLGIDDIFRLMQESEDGTLSIWANGDAGDRLVIDTNGNVDFGAGGTNATNTNSIIDLGFTDGGTESGAQIYKFGSYYKLEVDLALVSSLNIADIP